MGKTMYCPQCERYVTTVQPKMDMGIILVSILLILFFGLGLILLFGYLIYWGCKKDVCPICQSSNLKKEKPKAKIVDY
jgi:hypothetical protein